MLVSGLNSKSVIRKIKIDEFFILHYIDFVSFLMYTLVRQLKEKGLNAFFLFLYGIKTFIL